MDVAFLSPWEGRVEFAAGLVFEAPKKALRIVVNLDVPERVAGPGFDVVSKPATAGVPEAVAELLAVAAGQPLEQGAECLHNVDGQGGNRLPDRHRKQLPSLGARSKGG